MNKKRLFPIFFVLFFLILLFFLSFYFDKKSKQNKEVTPINNPESNLNQNKTNVPEESKEVKQKENILETSCGGKDSCQTKIVRVVDGDTVVAATGEKIRYVGVNTPEIHHPSKKVECFGQEASSKNKELVLEKEVKLVKDTSDKDRYGRLLRFVYVGDVFVNDFLVKNGYANVSTFPPDVKNKSLFLESEKYARVNQLGLWSEANCAGKK